MKFINFAAILLLVNTTEAAKVKTQAEMEAEIQAMSLSANMHQISLREKTLLKSYLEVDMNEFFQAQIDSATFADLDESSKA